MLGRWKKYFEELMTEEKKKERRVTRMDGGKLENEEVQRIKRK